MNETRGKVLGFSILVVEKIQEKDKLPYWNVYLIPGEEGVTGSFKTTLLSTYLTDPFENTVDYVECFRVFKEIAEDGNIHELIVEGNCKIIQHRKALHAAMKKLRYDMPYAVIAGVQIFEAGMRICSL